MTIQRIMQSDKSIRIRGESAVSATLVLVCTLVPEWRTTLVRWLNRAADRVSARRVDHGMHIGWPLAEATATVRSLRGQRITRVRRRSFRYVVGGCRVLTPATIALIGLVAMTGIAAATPPEGGVCGTPAVDLFEWGAQTGSKLLLLGGLLFGGYKHARAAMTPNPERARQHRRTGTWSVMAGPIFGIIIVFGKQAAGAAGMNVADCVNLLPSL